MAARRRIPCKTLCCHPFSFLSALLWASARWLLIGACRGNSLNFGSGPRTCFISRRRSPLATPFQINNSSGGRLAFGSSQDKHSSSSEAPSVSEGAGKILAAVGLEPRLPGSKVGILPPTPAKTWHRMKAASAIRSCKSSSWISTS